MAEFFSKAVNVLFLVAIMFLAGYFAGFASVPSGSPQLQRLSSETLSASANIVAVTQDGTGIVNQASVEIVPGSGRILLSVNPFIEPDTQDSAQTAALVAQKFTGKSLADRDFILSIENSQASLVGGPSAGAAFTLAAISAIENKPLNSNAAITGTIESDGSIGQVGGVIEKATAAAEKGLLLFVVPKGQSTVTYYEQKEQTVQRGSLTITRTYYVPQKINLQDFLNQQGFSMQITEASNIQEAVQLLIE